MDNLRLLDFDDLFLLSLLADGASVTAAAESLRLSQPAVTQRLRKIERVFDCALVQRSGRGVRLTPEAQPICQNATAALALMRNSGDSERAQVINVGTRPEAGLDWLGPVLVDLRDKYPNLTYHCVFGSGEELLRLLGGGKLDALLTSAPHTVRDFSAIPVATETYVLVAAPAIAKRLSKIADLRNEILIEHDRSFPFQRYLDAQTRAQMQFRDVWFAGSTKLMAHALMRGHGVGIVPEYLVSQALKTGKLKRLFSNDRKCKLHSDSFRLIYRHERGIDKPMELLANALKRRGLR